MPYEICLPSPGESITEAEVASWMKEDGEFVEKDEVICEVETDKASLEISAERSGTLRIQVQEGAVVEVGAILAIIEEGDQKPQASLKADEADAEASLVSKDTEATKVSVAEGHGPAVTRLVEENDLDVTKLASTGKDGRVTKGDVLNHLSGISKDILPIQSSNSEQKVVKSEKPQVKNVLHGSTRQENPVKMTRLRRKIADRLKEVQNTAAILTTFNEVDMSSIMDLRKRYKDDFKVKYGVNLGFMSLFTKAAVIALQKYPVVNSELRGDELIYRNYNDIGIAVGTDRGLVVPVVRDADKMSLSQIELEIMRLAIKAREGKLGIDDMSGGTFTISNGGVYGSMLSTPILNAPQTAIMGMHNIVKRPIAVGDQVVVRPVMYLALSYDHRVIDGSEAVQFLVAIKNCIEDPSRMLLELA
ncbi:MAG: 2-oxoglutarate dehydrogenase complex dihydrolipoyllysine-residue succinyltransferase [bacterium]|nr:2-oxoglutarate dehydrogenase complex dihydrolipoyllysine-residue succinyltransferase [bacterium]